MAGFHAVLMVSGRLLRTLGSETETFAGSIFLKDLTYRLRLSHRFDLRRVSHSLKVALQIGRYLFP